MSDQPIIFKWQPYPWQARAMLKMCMNLVLVCARQIGKTVLLLRILMGYAMEMENGLFWYISPTLDLAGEKYHDMKKILLDSGICTFNDTKKKITFVTGSVLQFRSYEQGNANRGFSVDGQVLDEVGSMTGAFVRDVIEPTTTNTGGFIIYCGTPPDPLESPDPIYFEDLVKFAKIREKTDPNWGFVQETHHAVSDFDPTYRNKIRQYAERNGGEDGLSFQREYLCKFVRDDELSLPHEKVRWYTYTDYDRLKPEHPLNNEMSVIVTVDPSVSERDAADPRGIVTTGLTPEGDLYVLRAEQGRWGWDDFIERIYRAYNHAKTEGWKPEFVSIEKAGVGAPLIKALEREGDITGRYLPIKPIPNYGSTMTRLLSLEPWLHDERIYLLDGDEGCSELAEQMELFPRGLLTSSGRVRGSSGLMHHYDILEALAFRTVNFHPPRRRKVTYEMTLEPGTYSFREEWDSVVKPRATRLTMHTG